MHEDIYRVVDKYFTFLEEVNGFNYIPEFIPENMKDNTRPPRYQGSQRWKVISSTVTDEQIEEYEEAIGLQLPNSYKYFLKYKHFIEMTIGPYQVVFFKNLSADWKETLLEESEYYCEQLEGRGFIPFAHFSDHGVICFDTNASVCSDLEYPVIWLDHEDGFDQETPLAKNFTDLMRRCELHLDEWIASGGASRDQGA